MSIARRWVIPLSQLGKTQWCAYFGRFLRPPLRRAHRWRRPAYLPLIRVSYEPESDTLMVTAGGKVHTIDHRRQVRIDHEDLSVHAVEVVDGEGVDRHLLLREAPDMRHERTTLQQARQAARGIYITATRARTFLLPAHDGVSS